MIALLAGSIGLATYAQGPGPQRTDINNHPRVDEINKRIDNQEERIARGRKEGKITERQAREERNNLRKINQEKQDMLKMDNGHLTTKDQQILNQQLDQNSQKIGN